jgi:Lrp/AsnC family leucine-responsive transcriptional regulator
LGTATLNADVKTQYIALVYNITGDYDFMLKVQVRDMRHYEVLVREKITKIRGIAKLNTSFVLGTTKYSTALPF